VHQSIVKWAANVCDVRWFGVGGSRADARRLSFLCCGVLCAAVTESQAQDTDLDDLKRQLEALTAIVERQAAEIDALKAATESDAASGEDHYKDLSLDQDTPVIAVHQGTTDIEGGDIILPTTGPSGRFPDDAIVQSGDFEGALKIGRTGASFKVGGLVRAEVSQDIDSLGFQDVVNHRTIPLDGSAQDGNAQSRFHVRNSRLNVDYRRSSRFGDVRAFVEFDFFGGGDEFINNYELRLRHAVVQFGDFYAGQWWSQFTDIPASPETVDFGPALGQPVLRNPGLRWSRDVGQQGKWQIGLGAENPAGDLTDQSERFASDKVPNFTSFIQTTRGWGHFRVAALGLQLDSDTDSQITGGVNVSSRIKTPFLASKDNIVFGLTAGEGFTHYYSVFAGQGLEGVIDSDGDIEATGILAGYVGYQHWWSNAWRSTLTYSALELDSPLGSDPLATESGRRYQANLFWTPVDNLDIGFEYSYAGREVIDGQQGDGSRVNAVLQLDF